MPHAQAYVVDRTDWNQPIPKQQIHRESITGPPRPTTPTGPPVDPPRPRRHKKETHKYDFFEDFPPAHVPTSPTGPRVDPPRPLLNHQKSSSQYADVEEKTQEQQQREIKEYQKRSGWTVEKERKRRDDARRSDYQKNRGRTNFRRAPTSAHKRAAYRRTNGSAETVYYNKYIA